MPKGPNKAIVKHYQSGQYWENRMDLVYYAYVDYVIRTIGRKATSMIDIGTGGCPYLEWFDWISERVSVDMAPPFESNAVTGIQGDFLEHDFGGQTFDICTCLQVLEHVPEPERFFEKMFDIAQTVVVTVPYKWPASAAADHIHDPVDYDKLTKWAGRGANYHDTVHEPFRGKVGWRLIAIYDRDETVGYGRKDFKDRVRRAFIPLPD